jgi:hypothetical protein
MAGAPVGFERWLVVISDGLEVSCLGDFECGKLPAPDHFVRKLQGRSVLGRDALRGVQVRMAYLGLAPVDRGRCAMSVARAAEVRNL